MSMNLEKLVARLLPHFQAPQKSERWSMYRLISPVIDYANETLRFTVYFELNQTSHHGQSQSVDIALLDGERPVVLVEAKRAGRTISSDQIDKYLQADERGLVSDGFQWILCKNRDSARLLIYDGNEVSRDALSKLIVFIRGGAVSGLTWTGDTILVETDVRPRQPKKTQRASRVSNPVVRTDDFEHLTSQVRGLPKVSPIQASLLGAILSRIQERGGSLGGMRWEVRSSRISIFHDDVPGRGSSHRLARLLLDVGNPDVLVLNAIADLHPRLADIAKPAPHDKHPGMRRFRLGNETQAQAFGAALVEALLAHTRLSPHQRS